MVLPAGLYGVPNAANTLFFVFQNDKSGPSIPLLGTGANSNSYTLNFNEGGSNNGRQYKHGGTTFYTSAAGIDPRIHGWSRNGINLSFFENGSALASGVNAASNTLSSLHIIGPNSSRATGGAWGEVVIFSRALSTAELNQVGIYLSDKWNIVWSGL